MIEIKEVDGPMVVIEMTGKLHDAEFGPLEAQIDNQIALCGSIRLLIDAQGLDGWETMSASRASVALVRNRRSHVDKLALIVTKSWHEWMAELADVLIDGQLLTFSQGQQEAAKRWLAA